MNKTVLASIRNNKKENKKKRQAKIMMILGIIMAVVTVGLTAAWLGYNIHTTRTRALTDAEMRALFETNDGIPEKDDTMIGTWFYYAQNVLTSKYVLDENGVMSVYMLENGEFVLYQTAEYRVRESAKEIYVHMEGQSSVIPYSYEINKDPDGEALYMMTWTHEDTAWVMVKLAKE